jgi:hypothetical protein
VILALKPQESRYNPQDSESGDEHTGTGDLVHASFDALEIIGPPVENPNRAVDIGRKDEATVVLRS